MTHRVAFHTLGCKVNQYETGKIREAMEMAGFETVAFDSLADVYIINTCTVTQTADQKSRHAIRKARRLNPDAYVVATGCYTQLEVNQAAGIDGVDLVVPNEDKLRIAELLSLDFCGPELIHNSELKTHNSRTRAFVKVQDGCDHYCAYCIVPYARPTMTSRPLAEVIAEIEAVAAAGHKEVVLTGIRLGSYNFDDYRLPDLIGAVAEVNGIERIRLSSVEPWEVSDALLDAMQRPKACRHLHIPLQSGDDVILESMGRPYTGAEYLKLISRVRERIPGIGITTDVMVGFPGESDEAFGNTMRVIESAEFSRLHVFRYSPRPRTKAAEMLAQVSEPVKKSRAEMLLKLGEECVRRFAQSLLGQTVEVLVESRSKSVKRLVGYADNYVAVVFQGDLSLCGEIASVKIMEIEQDGKATGIMSCEL